MGWVDNDEWLADRERELTRRLSRLLRKQSVTPSHWYLSHIELKLAIKETIEELAEVRQDIKDVHDIRQGMILNALIAILVVAIVVAVLIRVIS